MRKGTITKLRQKLREAEERGYKTALNEMSAFVDDRIEQEVTHRPDVNIYKRTLSETWNQVKRKIIELQFNALA